MIKVTNDKMSGNCSEPSSSSSVVIPWGQSTRSSPRLREKQLVFEVLDNPSLREEILKHVIIGGDKKVDCRTACTLRLVDKSWNESVLRILWKAHEPLYKVALEDVGNLDVVTETFALSSEIIVSGPPAPLKLDDVSELTQRAELESFSNFLNRCGPALLQLDIIFYDFTAPVPFVLPPWSLPRLHKLSVLVELVGRKLLADGEQPEVPVNEEIPEYLIRHLFLGATALAELSLTIDDCSRYEPADVSMFDSITFPPTLVKLKLVIGLNLQLSTDLVNAVLKNHLPKVTSLNFISLADAFAERILFSLMDKWKSSLKNLVIEGRNNHGLPRNVTTIRLPVMKQLEEFSMSSVTVELESGLRSLETFFPKLHTLRLRGQTPEMIRKWSGSSRFSLVTNLELIFSCDHRDFLVSQGMEAMQLVSAAFSHLRKLELGISKRDSGGLWYVFQEMRELVELKLIVYSYLSLEGTTNEWDSILTGVSPEMMASILGTDPGSLEAGENFVPINNLQELKRFSVFFDAGPLRRSLISDFIFEHAFLRMPKLTHLHFEGPFRVSAKMVDRWMSEEGRRLVCQRVDEEDSDS